MHISLSSLCLLLNVNDEGREREERKVDEGEEVYNNKE